MELHEQIWSVALARLKTSLDIDVYSRWIAVISSVSLCDGVLTVAVDNEMLKMWVENNYLPYILDAVRIDSANQVSEIEIVVDSSRTPAVAVAEEAEASEPASGPAVARKRSSAASPRVPRFGEALNPNYTFADFVIGPSNSFSQAASAAVAANPGNAYNPLFIYGDTGLGKTHLMQAVAHGVLSQNPSSVVCYITSEGLLNDFIDSIRNNSMVDFRNRYRNVDVLLIDDIHFLADKDTMQEEFFHTFNTLQNARKQIIMTSDRPLNKIQGLESRLVSRFQQGLITSIERPGFETRLAILRYKQRNATIQLADPLLTFIAESITSNVRQLEGAITRAVCFASLARKDLTIDVLRDLLKDMIDFEKRPELTCLDIQRVVADDYDLRLSDMTSKERPQSVALPRQIAMFLCRTLTNGSLLEIAAAFEKTHATILHACKTIPGRMETDPDLKRRVELIVEKLGRDPSSLLLTSAG
ncbi:MAG: chromosomal replication initiator protein DnaA [Kiritimatiellia bacterium]